MSYPKSLLIGELSAQLTARLLFESPCRLRDFHKRVRKCNLSGLSGHLPYQGRPADCDLRPADCDLRPADCDLRPADCDLRPADCDLRPADRVPPPIIPKGYTHLLFNAQIT